MRWRHYRGEGQLDWLADLQMTRKGGEEVEGLPCTVPSWEAVEEEAQLQVEEVLLVVVHWRRQLQGEERVWNRSIRRLMLLSAELLDSLQFLSFCSILKRRFALAGSTWSRLDSPFNNSSMPCLLIC